MTSPSNTAATLIPRLRAELDGRVIAPDDGEFDAARAVFYGKFDRRPAVIVRPKDAAEVARVVSAARDAGAELTVRSGGHSVAGHSMVEGAIVIDMANMRRLEFDTRAKTAWAETGLTAGEYTKAAGEHGLATGFGDTGSVGIGGLTLGGGVGFLVRKYGLTIDDLLAAEVVTADGQVRHVDAQEEPDLFWAIRGGGGNFGVATRFKYRLHEVGTIVGGLDASGHAGCHRVAYRRGRCRAGGVVGHRERDGRTTDAVHPARASWPDPGHGLALLRRPERGRRTRGRAVPQARDADHGHGWLDALSRDLSTAW